MTPAALVEVGVQPTDLLMRELDQLSETLDSLPPGAVEAVRTVLERLLADELKGPQREAAERILALVTERA